MPRFAFCSWPVGVIDGLIVQVLESAAMLARIKFVLYLVGGLACFAVLLAIGSLGIYLALDSKFIIAAAIATVIVVVFASAINYWYRGENPTP